jgi:hypothetical protein
MKRTMYHAQHTLGEDGVLYQLTNPLSDQIIHEIDRELYYELNYGTHTDLDRKIRNVLFACLEEELEHQHLNFNV